MLLCFFFCVIYFYWCYSIPFFCSCSCLNFNLSITCLLAGYLLSLFLLLLFYFTFSLSISPFCSMFTFISLVLSFRFVASYWQNFFFTFPIKSLVERREQQIRQSISNSSKCLITILCSRLHGCLWLLDMNWKFKVNKRDLKQLKCRLHCVTSMKRRITFAVKTFFKPNKKKKYYFQLIPYYMLSSLTLAISIWNC